MLEKAKQKINIQIKSKTMSKNSMENYNFQMRKSSSKIIFFIKKITKKILNSQTNGTFQQSINRSGKVLGFISEK